MAVQSFYIEVTDRNTDEAQWKIKKLFEILEQLSDYIHTIISCANIDRKQFIPKKILSFFWVLFLDLLFGEQDIF